MDNLPTEGPAPSLKLQSTKRQKTHYLTKEEYEVLSQEREIKENKLIEDMVKLSLNIKDDELETDVNLKHTFDQLVAQKKAEMVKERKVTSERLSGPRSSVNSKISSGKNMSSNPNLSEVEGSHMDDIYSVEDIYSRDLMTPQERRFGSPEFAVRDGTMMYEPPTTNLESVKPGVQLQGNTVLIGPKYDEEEFYDCEVEESEEENSLASENDLKIMVSQHKEMINGQKLKTDIGSTRGRPKLEIQEVNDSGSEAYDSVSSGNLLKKDVKNKNSNKDSFKNNRVAPKSKMSTKSNANNESFQSKFSNIAPNLELKTPRVVNKTRLGEGSSSALLQGFSNALPLESESSKGAPTPKFFNGNSHRKDRNTRRLTKQPQKFIRKLTKRSSTLE